MAKKAKRAGRPANPQGVTHAGHYLAIRCTTEERTRWRLAADRDGCTVTELIRRLLDGFANGIISKRK